jgi:two-component system alkaline phosphatase synthesis response regulator PhoP
MTRKVMLVDDDATIVETLEYNLKRHGYATVSFNSGQNALAGLDTADPDLIILDWMLGDMAGPDVCKLIRSRFVEVPILMLTGRSAPNDVAHGLTSGADDYLSKPFSTIELMARVQALLRRAAKEKPKSASKLQVGGLFLDEDARSVRSGSREVDLSPKEFMLLKVLMQNCGKTLSSEALLNEVWGSDFAGDVKTVAVHMRWLRQKLEEDPKNPRLLKTIHRSGYRLTADGAAEGEETGED